MSASERRFTFRVMKLGLLKKVFALLVIIAFVFCKHRPVKTDAGLQTVALPDTAQAPVPRRDSSITRKNSFNDLFFDSLRMEEFLLQEKASDEMMRAMRSFYNVRNYEYAWFSHRGLIEQSFSFRSLYTSAAGHDFLNVQLERQLDRLRAGHDTVVNGHDPATIRTELQITETFIRYAVINYARMGISPDALGTYIPAQKRTTLGYADFVLAKNPVNDQYAQFNKAYRLLKDPLKHYTEIARNGDFPNIPATAKNIEKGTSGEMVSLVKKRLQMSGELDAAATGPLFDSSLENALKAYQRTHGFSPSGELKPETIRDLNVTALARIRQLILNMQRMRWLPTRPEGIFILVNIPQFQVFVDSSTDILFEMPVVVGRDGHNTTMFSGSLNQIVFSPYWNVPPSIVRHEVVPGMIRNPEYLKQHRMEITGRAGGLPVVRQLPGKNNSLGKVKFLFPNSFNIYMHDTPEKEFFDRSSRGLSHGCIRLSNAPKLADFLLRNSKAWTPEKITAAMDSGDERFVPLKPAIPVIISYYTAWVDETGELRFAADIYRHDAALAVKMFSDPK